MLSACLGLPAPGGLLWPLSHSLMLQKGVHRSFLKVPKTHFIRACLHPPPQPLRGAACLQTFSRWLSAGKPGFAALARLWAVNTALWAVTSSYPWDVSGHGGGRRCSQSGRTWRQHITGAQPSTVYVPPISRTHGVRITEQPSHTKQKRLEASVCCGKGRF